MTDKEKHLYYLEELSGYKVESGKPDIRGWSVKDKDDQQIGKVDGLLVHKEMGQVVYLDVEVDKSVIQANSVLSGKPIDEFENQEEENHVIVPIGYVSIDEKQQLVRADKIDHSTVAKTKRIRKGDRIGRTYEETVLKVYDQRNKLENNEDLGIKKGFETRSDTSYVDNFYKRKAFDRSPPFRFKL